MLQEIEEDLVRLEGYLEALRCEVARLRQKVRHLEQEQEQEQMDEPVADSILPEETSGETPVTPGGGESQRNLVDLYEQGYHVCNVHFGQRRWGQDCLFCNALLSRGQAEA